MANCFKLICTWYHFISFICEAFPGSCTFRCVYSAHPSLLLQASTVKCWSICPPRSSMPAEMTMLADHTARQLLDFSQKLDINLLDNVVNSMYHDIGSQVTALLLLLCSGVWGVFCPSKVKTWDVHFSLASAPNSSIPRVALAHHVLYVHAVRSQSFACVLLSVYKILFYFDLKMSPNRMHP